MGKSIFVLTVLSHTPEKAKAIRAVNWGWFSSLEAAKETFEAHPDAHLESGYYRYAVIEEIPEGTHTHAKQLVWYDSEYREKDGIYYCTVKVCDSPEFAHGICDFWA